MANPLAELNYPELFTALGKFIAAKNLQDVCVMEYEDGIIVSGSVLYPGRAMLSRSLETFVLPTEELKRMLGSSNPPSQKRGLFGH